MTYLNIDNISVSLGPTMSAEPFRNVSTINSLRNVIDAPSPEAEETHNQQSHVWFTGPELVLEFDLGQEYELTELHFWNYHTEQYDVDKVKFLFYDSGDELVGWLDFTPDLGVGTVQRAQDYTLNFPNRIQYVVATLSGTNSEVDFNNIGFTGTLGEQDPGGTNRITGDGSSNIIEGTAFRDRISGLAGRDAIDGLEGDDVLNGGRGKDTLFGGSGDDVLRGGSNDDKLNGGIGDDILDGGSGFDKVSYADARGGVRVDLSIEGPQDTDRRGESLTGMDTLISIEGIEGSDYADRLRGNDGPNVINGGKGRDIIWGYDGFDWLYGGKGADTIYGGADGDELYGQNGDDSLFGGAGNDYLTGGRGDDYLKGGRGVDRFVFDDKPGHDIIADFKPNVDDLVFERSADVRDYLDFLSKAEDTPDGVVVTLDANRTFLIEDITLSQLDKDDFAFF